MKKLALIIFLLFLTCLPFIGCTPVIPCVGEGIINGGFETGNFSGWAVATSDLFPKVQSAQVFTGVFAAHLGDGASGLYDGITNTASIQQTVSIPACATNATLKLNYRVNGTDGASYDWMKVYINGTEIKKVYSDSGGWQQFQYDLSGYIGSSVVLKISAWTIDSFVAVNYYVDNVSISWN
jgi:hypothetical protein